MKTAVPLKGQAKKNDLKNPVSIDVHGYYSADNTDMQGAEEIPAQKNHKNRADPKVRPGAVSYGTQKRLLVCRLKVEMCPDRNTGVL